MSNGLAGIIIGYIGIGIISLILIVCAVRALKDKDLEIFWNSLFISIFVSILIIALPLSIGYDNRHHYYDTYETIVYENIESVDRGPITEGSFALFSGYVDTKIAYYFYVNTEYGHELKYMKATSTKRVFLVEDDTRLPQIIEKKEVGKCAYIQIIVPGGTVVKEYNG